MGLANHFGHWLRAVRAEAEAPDIWGAAEAQRSLGGTAGEPNTPIRPDGLRELRLKLDEIRQFVEQVHATTGDLHRSLDEKFEYLKAAAERQPRVDWRNIAAGTIFQLAVDAGLKSDEFKSVWNFAASQINQVLNFARQLTS